ncbi:DnaB-like helicase C-terminal domain-containing protein [Streptomyces hirsutus]|uniref:DnaB-like helicase C-terminal domain-containing protein n=1 Tax=Streptomyces hirsutus TaxID=35620 RepID=UPI00369547DB
MADSPDDKFESNPNPAAHAEPSHIGNVLASTLDLVEDAGAGGDEQQPGLLGYPTGFPHLDAFTGGLEPGTLTVIASRPGIGRTTLLTDICRRNAITDASPVLVFTLEESQEAFVMRVLSAEARVARHYLRSGRMADEDWKRLAKTLPLVSSAPLFVEAPASTDMKTVREIASRMVEKHGVVLVAIDGIQDVRPEKRSDLREREVGDVVRDIKTLARELSVPVVATSHLNRGPENRFGRKPELDDLRESGAITFAADTLLLLHRPDAHDKLDRPGEADVWLAKHRQGPTGVVTLVFMGHYGRFAHLEREPEEDKPKPPADWLTDWMKNATCRFSDPVSFSQSRCHVTGRTDTGLRIAGHCRHSFGWPCLRSGVGASRGCERSARGGGCRRSGG